MGGRAGGDPKKGARGSRAWPAGLLQTLPLLSPSIPHSDFLACHVLPITNSSCLFTDFKVTYSHTDWKRIYEDRRQTGGCQNQGGGGAVGTDRLMDMGFPFEGMGMFWN